MQCRTNQRNDNNNNSNDVPSTGTHNSTIGCTTIWAQNIMKNSWRIGVSYHQYYPNSSPIAHHVCYVEYSASSMHVTSLTGVDGRPRDCLIYSEHSIFIIVFYFIVSRRSGGATCPGSFPKCFHRQ